jgi:D-alanyl-D-alanine carboxypeptidase/D-alanyl-D-alanine-endopeptidase (penicillin-binding protein 4)
VSGPSRNPERAGVRPAAFVRRFTIVAFTLLLGACGARASTPKLPESPRHDAREHLRRELESLFMSPATEHAQWSASFRSLQTAETLYSLNASRFMVPASSQKLLTTAVAAERLGWDFQYTTRVVSTAPVGEDGTIDGDVIVVGSGDPTINPRHPQRWRAFDDWAAALKARGVTIISGRLIGDDNAFAEPAWGFGWSWDDLHYGYGAEPSALQFNENQIDVLVGPGMTVGSRAIIATSPLGSDMVIDHGVTTVSSGEQTIVEIARLPGTTLLGVRGQIAVGARPLTVTASVENPTRFFVTALREALARNGIFVSGGVADVDDLRDAVPHGALHELIVDRSPPLAEIIDVTLKWSRNIYAESLLLSLAPADAPASGARGLEPLRETLATWGIGREAYLARDGSGLSRYDYVTADAMTTLLSHLSADPTHVEHFPATLPVSGVSGTLANRMKGTPAEGRVRAKTGTMSHVRTLCGYLTTLDGELVAFAILANDFRLPPADIDAVMDKAVNLVVQFER